MFAVFFTPVSSERNLSTRIRDIPELRWGSALAPTCLPRLAKFRCSPNLCLVTFSGATRWRVVIVSELNFLESLGVVLVDIRNHKIQIQAPRRNETEQLSPKVEFRPDPPCL